MLKLKRPAAPKEQQSLLFTTRCKLREPEFANPRSGFLVFLNPDYANSAVVLTHVTKKAPRFVEVI